MNVNCRNCNTPLIETDDNYHTCPGCLEPVCFYCGCTPQTACTYPVVDGVMTCGWLRPGLCNFCPWRIAEAMYAAATADITQRISLAV